MLQPYQLILWSFVLRRIFEAMKFSTSFWKSLCLEIFRRFWPRHSGLDVTRYGLQGNRYCSSNKQITKTLSGHFHGEWECERGEQNKKWEKRKDRVGQDIVHTRGQDWPMLSSSNTFVIREFSLHIFEQVSNGKCSFMSSCIFWPTLGYVRSSKHWYWGYVLANWFRRFYFENPLVKKDRFVGKK